jgi:hypothetical protein
LFCDGILMHIEVSPSLPDTLYYYLLFQTRAFRFFQFSVIGKDLHQRMEQAFLLIVISLFLFDWG